MKINDYVQTQEPLSKILTPLGFFERVLNIGTGTRYTLIKGENGENDTLTDSGKERREVGFVVLHVIALIVGNVFTLIALAAREGLRAKLPQVTVMRQSGLGEQTTVASDQSQPIGGRKQRTIAEEKEMTKEELEAAEALDAAHAAGGGAALEESGSFRERSQEITDLLTGRITAHGLDQIKGNYDDPPTVAKVFQEALEFSHLVAQEVSRGVFLGAVPDTLPIGYIPADFDIKTHLKKQSNFNILRKVLMSDGYISTDHDNMIKLIKALKLEVAFKLKKSSADGNVSGYAPFKFDSVVNVYGRRDGQINPSEQMVKTPQSAPYHNFANYDDEKGDKLPNVEVEASKFGGSEAGTSEEINQGIDRYKEAIRYIDAKVENGETVYVHCKQGRDRSAAVVYGYLKAKTDLPEVDILQAMSIQRANVNLFTRVKGEEVTKMAHWYIDPANQAAEELKSDSVDLREEYIQRTLAVSDELLRAVLD